MTRRPLFLTLAIVVVAGCGGSSAPPAGTSPTAPTPSATAAPVAALSLQVDDGRPRDAISMLSDVVADASGSTGSGTLTFAIEFGDGAVATTPIAHHTYGKAGTFAVTATATDAGGRKASTIRSIEVKNVVGAWYQAGYVPRSSKVEVRHLMLTLQEGLAVSGTYQVDGPPDRAVAGTLSPPRHLHLVANGGVVLDGDLPGRLGEDLQSITLTLQGDSLDGRQVQFLPILGSPAGDEPRAIFRMWFGNGTLVAPVASVTPVQIDAGSSRGSGLAYFLEFGDGFVATTTVAAHPVDAPALPAVAARVTVVDRFGRSDSVTQSYNTFELGINSTPFEWGFWQTTRPPLWISFRQHSGNQFSGFIADDTPGLPLGGVPVTAVVSGDGTHIHLCSPHLGAEWEGTIQLAVKSIFSGVTLTVVQRGGRHDGTTYVVPYFSDI